MTNVVTAKAMGKDVETKPHERLNTFSKLRNFTAGPTLSAEDFGRMQTMSSVSVTLPDSEVKIKHVASATSLMKAMFCFSYLN